MTYMQLSLRPLSEPFFSYYFHHFKERDKKRNSISYKIIVKSRNDKVMKYKYVALLRGINVGGNKKIDMKKLISLFESLGYTNIKTYINSGNVLFESNKKQMIVQKDVETSVEKEFGFEIPTLVKTKEELITIADAIPKEWQNDPTQKTDVAYLFHEIDSEKIIDELPIKKEYVDIRYTKGAIFWNVPRKNYNKSHVNKNISHRFYQQMTVRNVNTARYLAGKK